jgi:glycosyltransferase involved in cell wall biosynthesis
MKILHVSSGDLSGGAARAAYRIHQALVGVGFDSRMQVLHKGTLDDRVQAAPRPTIRRVANGLLNRWLTYTRRDWYTNNAVLHTFGQTSAGLADELNAGDADILNLHWISNILSVPDIGRLKKPIVWTLHDMWPFCGGEHYAADGVEARFRQGYQANNRPVDERGPDLNRHTWEAKRKAWARQRFTIISPSRWLASCAQQSVLFANADVHVIPNPLNTHYPWRPVSREVARTALGLPLDKKLVLMGAHGGVVDPRKGGDLLHEAIARIASNLGSEMELMIYGQRKSTSDNHWPCKVHWLDVIQDDRLLALAYSAANVMVVPSRQDNLPNTAVEAQACGIPVVAFNIGGLPDIIEHQHTGWLARPFDTTDLAAGITWILADVQRARNLAIAAREQVERRFSEPVIADQYRSVYKTVLAEQAGNHPSFRNNNA